MKKRLISGLTSFLMALSLIPATAFAASDSVKVEVGSGSGKAGEHVIIDVDMTENPGMNIMTLSFEWNSDAMTLAYCGVEDMDDQSGILPMQQGMDEDWDDPDNPVYGYSENGKGYGTVILGNATLKSKGKFIQYTATGRILTMDFLINSDAESGDYTISVFDGDGNGARANDESGTSYKVPITFANGKITVEGSTPVHTCNPTIVEGFDPTCTVPGQKTYYECTCGKWYEDSTGNVEITDKNSVVIPATGHSFVLDTSKGENGYEWSSDNKTCTAYGKCSNKNCTETTTEVSTASSQGTEPTCIKSGTVTYTAEFKADWAENQTKNVTSDPVATAHEKLDHVSAVAPKCGVAGNKEYYYCPDCKKYFTDAAGTTETTLEAVTLAALEHNWGEIDYQWSDDHKTCTATQICANDTDKTHVKTETVTAEDQSEAAECGQPGVVKFVATFTQYPEFGTRTYEENVDALEHDWGKVSYGWDGTSCTATRVCGRCKAEESKTVSLTETANGKVTQTDVPATCEAAGYTTYTAVFTDTAFGTDSKTVDGDPATGHNWNFSYEWADDYSSCTYNAVCKNDATHKKTGTVASTSEETVKPGCETAGKTTYRVDFKNALPGIQNQTKEVDTDSTGHKWEAPVYNWAEIEGGYDYTATLKCSACNDEKTIHANVVKNTTPATCTTAEKITYTATFEDTALAGATKEVTGEDALGHLYSYSYSWSVDMTTCTATAQCSRDASHKYEETVNTVEKVTKQPGCGVEGEKVYTATFTKEGFVEQTSEPVKIDALKHEFDSVSYEWNSDRSSCTASGTCKHCSEKLTETATVEGGTIDAVTTEPKCTVDGNTTYTAHFDMFVDDDISDTIKATGHDFEGVEPTYTWSDDFSQCTAMRKCKKCNEAETETVNAAFEEDFENSKVKITAEFTNEAFETQVKEETLEVTYTATDIEWTKGSGSDAQTTVKRSINDAVTYSEFQSAVMDDEEIAPENFTTEAGSLILNLKNAYLETLAEGEHTVTVKFTHGEAIAKLKVNPKPAEEPSGDDGQTDDKPSEDGNKPSDGDSSPDTGAAGAAGAFVVVIAAAAVVLKRKK